MTAYPIAERRIADPSRFDAYCGKAATMIELRRGAGDDSLIALAGA